MTAAIGGTRDETVIARPSFGCQPRTECERFFKAGFSKLKEANIAKESPDIAAYLIYGANGYTARLIVREAMARGLPPVLAGRNAPAVEELARQERLEHRIFALDDPIALDAGLKDVAVVLNCAGPFSRTAKPMAEACIRCGVHYLDITGEISVFEELAARDAEAKSAGVMLLPGVGFDVVPSDCLAAHLKRRLPTATALSLGFQAIGRFSRGTATTMVENLAKGGMIRRGGKLTRVPTAWRTRTIDFGRGPVRAMTIPWGDVSTAYRSTGIPDIEVYTAAAFSQVVVARLLRLCGWAVASRLVQNYLKGRIKAGPAGPTDEERARGESLLWGEATDAHGGRVESRIRGPEGYTLTASSAVAVIARVLKGEAPPGFQTPSLAYGADFVLMLPGVSRSDE
jgi:short subunit dehydrogenase-like uncharacterized protein